MADIREGKPLFKISVWGDMGDVVEFVE